MGDAATSAIAVYGIDFTSRPTRGKPITCIECRLVGDLLQAVKMRKWRSFEEFERFLATPPAGTSWITGIDFPFGLPLRFIENMGWPTRWAEYIDQKVQPLDRASWRKTLDDYKRPRPAGDKEHLRATDRAAGSLSPQKQYGVPVGMMFFEGAPRLRRAGVMIPGLQDGSPRRLVVEAYPGIAVRHLVGRVSYKDDSGRKQTEEQLTARKRIPKRAGARPGCNGLRYSGSGHG